MKRIHIVLLFLAAILLSARASSQERAYEA